VLSVGGKRQLLRFKGHVGSSKIEGLFRSGCVVRVCKNKREGVVSWVLVANGLPTSDGKGFDNMPAYGGEVFGELSDTATEDRVARCVHSRTHPGMYCARCVVG
jgi:hypothetical protein